jgi:hypothetical protein
LNPHMKRQRRTIHRSIVIRFHNHQLIVIIELLAFSALPLQVSITLS